MKSSYFDLRDMFSDYDVLDYSNDTNEWQSIILYKHKVI